MQPTHQAQLADEVVHFSAAKAERGLHFEDVFFWTVSGQQHVARFHGLPDPLCRRGSVAAKGRRSVSTTIADDFQEIATYPDAACGLGLVRIERMNYMISMHEMNTPQHIHRKQRYTRSPSPNPEEPDFRV